MPMKEKRRDKKKNTKIQIRPKKPISLRIFGRGLVALESHPSKATAPTKKKIINVIGFKMVLLAFL